jgi:hypothetical protein
LGGSSSLSDIAGRIVKFFFKVSGFPKKLRRK